MFRSMISSRKITFRISRLFSSVVTGRLMILGRTAGTCTIANSSSLPPSFFFKSAAIFKDLFLTSGNGLEESTAIGVRTG